MYSTVCVAEANDSQVGCSLHLEPPPLPSSFSPFCLMGSYWCRTVLTSHTITSGQAMAGSFAWIPPLPLSGTYKECSTNSTVFFGMKTDCRKILSFLKLAKGNTQNIKEIICDFCLIFLCYFPIFFVKL